MEDTAILTISDWRFSAYEDPRLLELSIEAPDYSELLISKNIGHGSFIKRGFFHHQRLKASVAFIKDTMQEAYNDANRFISWANANIQAGTDNIQCALKISQGKWGYGAITSISMSEIDEKLKNGIATVNFEFAFTNNLFFSTWQNFYSLNRQKIVDNYGVDFPVRFPFSYRSKTVYPPEKTKAHNTGQLPAPLLLRFKGACNNPIVQINNLKIPLNVTLQNNDVLEIDNISKQVLRNGTPSDNIFRLGNCLSDFTLPIGENMLSVTGAYDTADFTWRDTYASL